jgi:uncharacterized protein YndB with AHSA1/START domain
MGKNVQLKLTRLLPATREEVFDMWLDPASLTHWMRPGGADVIFIEVHPVVGGTFRFDVQTQDGSIFSHTGEYLEILRPQKLRFSWQSTVLGERVSQVTVEFFQQAENCLMVLIHELPPDEAMVEDHRLGWNAIIDLLVQTHRLASKKPYS